MSVYVLGEYIYLKSCGVVSCCLFVKLLAMAGETSEDLQYLVEITGIAHAKRPVTSRSPKPHGTCMRTEGGIPSGITTECVFMTCRSYFL